MNTAQTIVPPKIANRAAREYVQSFKPFKASNMFAEWVVSPYMDPVDGKWNKRRIYVVYSYTKYWPLFVYDSAAEIWFENIEKFSVSTSKHRSQAHPLQPTITCEAEVMRNVITDGVNAVVLRGDREAHHE